MKLLNGLVLLLSLIAPTPLPAHEIIQKVSHGPAVVIELSHSDGSPFSHQQYEIYRKGEDTPYQTGRSDALGRIVFVPDRRGTWRIRAFSEDGHGADITAEAGPETATRTMEDSSSTRLGKIGLGLVVILGVFMIVFVRLRRRGM